MAEKISLDQKIKISQEVKNKTYTFAGVTILVFSVLLIFAIQPTIATITKIMAEVEAKDVVNNQLTAKIDALSALETEYQGDPNADSLGYKSVFQDMSLIFPTKGDFSFIMASIENLCSTDGFSIESISFDKVDLQDVSKMESSFTVLKPWKVVLNLKGSKSNFVTLLQDIEELPNYPTVSRVIFTNQADENGDINFTVEIKVYKVEDPSFYSIDQLFTGIAQ
jgi:Tfp pilus assembly protein PilO